MTEAEMMISKLYQGGNETGMKARARHFTKAHLLTREAAFSALMYRAAAVKLLFDA